MTPTEALETLSTLARSYKGTFEEHAHLAECTAILIAVLKDNQLWEEKTEGVENA